MHIFLVKSILAVIFLGAGIVGLLSMLALMGRSEHKTSPLVLRNLHRAMGIVFIALLIVTSYVCITYVARVGDQISLRATLHGVSALALIAVLALKIVIIRWFKNFLRFVPVLGMIVFVLAFVVVTTSAGYYFVRAAGLAAGASSKGGTADEISQAGLSGGTTPELPGGNVGRGRLLFDDKCSSCHETDTDDAGFAPGLKHVLKKGTLPHSGRPATVQNVLKQLESPVGMMPSYTSLSEQELADLVGYLKTL